MLTLDENRAMRLLAIFVTSMACITRFNIVLAEVINKFIFVWGILMYVCYSKKVSLTPDTMGYIKAYGIFSLLVIPSVLFSDNLQTGIEVFLHMWVWPYIPFITIIAFMRRRDYLVTMLTVFLLFCGVECMYTLVQVMKHMIPENRGWGFGGNTLLSIADVMCMLLPIALVVLMDSRFEKKLKRAAAFSVIGTLIGLVCNKSRGAWLTEIIVVPIAAFRYLKQNKKYLVVFALVFMGMAGYIISNPHYMQRIYSIVNMTTDRSNADRIWTWKSAKLMIKDYPVTGVGLGQFRDKYERYKYEQESQNLPHTHNNFIQITVESGLVGMAGFLSFVIYYLYRSWNSYRDRINPYDLLIFTTFLGHICLFGQIDYTLWHGAETQPVFWFLLAVLMKLKETDEQESDLPVTS